MPVFPLRLTVEIAPPETQSKDRLGNPVRVPGKYRTVRCHSWEINQSVETTGDSVERVITHLLLHVPPEDKPEPGGKIRLPDGSVWDVAGDADTYTENPWFDPGLVGVRAINRKG
ncbi:hypothetical protein OS128_05175 [Corynebacterium sp. P5848]|uniref:hypothetical protein n=1 Tax=Corynebacterium marambiense TaxID=2765364 RepID=UPI0022608670|nr:hypothetical protein [Corynebacterium marambiense]MCX7542302.1 hypothetical protein [Corynebacterium marambiense]